MAKQTGQITYPKNNQILNFEETVRFIFTKNNGERITRDTTAKGVINFDIPNGDWNVSWFAVSGDQVVAQLRAGLQLKITSSTPPTALADWIYGDNTHVADPILAGWKETLDEMKAVRDSFRNETQSAGTGKFVKESITDEALMFRGAISNNTDLHTLDYGVWSVGANAVADSFTNGFKGMLKGIIIVYKHGSTLEEKILQYYSYDNTIQANKTLYTTGSNVRWYDWVIYAPSKLIEIGNFGFGTANSHQDLINPRDWHKESGYRGLFSSKSNYTPMGATSCWGHFCVVSSRANNGGSMLLSTIYERKNIHAAVSTSSSEVPDWFMLLSDRNTVVDSNGNYKQASPVIQLHHNRVEYNEDFDKDNPPKFDHLETGVYRITNVREICKDGWTFNKPINGKGQPFFMLKYEQEDETTLIVRVFERTFNSKTGEFGFGEPRDIGEDERWIDFHFEVDHERIAQEEAQMQKEQEEWEEQERLRKEAEEQAEKEAQEAWEAEIARQEAEMMLEMKE